MATLVLLLLLSSSATAQPALALLEKTLALRYPSAQLKSDSLATRLATADSATLLLFDVRHPDEFAVSYIHGAVRVDPTLTAEEFDRSFAATVNGKQLVFYCSVGYRSSMLIERVRKHAFDAGAVSVANLRGGIFRWYNEKRPLYNGLGKTDTVHHNNEFWGKLLKKR